MAENLFDIEGLAGRLENVRGRIVTAAQACGRKPGEVLLVAISKTYPPNVLRAVIDLGVADLGENRVQEAEEKITSIGRTLARWHLVGHLQGNKARRAVELFDCLHSLDSVDLAQRLERVCEEEGREVFQVLIQVKLGGEETKTGIAPENLGDLLRVLRGCRHVRLIGLMILPPFFKDPTCARPFFKTLRELRDELKLKGHFGELPGELSMGMSHDFEVAIEEGATMVRVGTSIFGERT